LGNQGRWEYLRASYERYQREGRKGKQGILSEFCTNTGYHRKYAIRLLNGPRPQKRPPRPRPRGMSYSRETVAVLTAVWEAAGYPWSVRLKALLPNWMPWIRKRFGLAPAVERELLRISPRQMDRRLQAQKTRQKRRIYGVFAQAPHSGEDRSLGGAESGFYGSGLGIGPAGSSRTR
jgi:hypothetical protein